MRTTGLEFRAKGDVGVCELGPPGESGPAQVIVETKYSGVTNGTERHALLVEHGYGGGSFPSRHGYQHVGQIVAAGDGVSGFREGDWVFYGGYVGHRAWHVVNAGDLLIGLPDSVDRRLCALFGVAAVALRGVRRMGVGPGANVWVVGQGPIGNFAGQAARAAGARVTVTDLLPNRLEAARACGAELALDAADPDTPERLRARGPFDFIYDCCSAQDLLFDIFAQRLLAFGGTIGLMAVRQTVTYPWSLLHSTQGRIETSCHFDRDDLMVLLFLVAQGRIRIEPMVSHILPIDEAPGLYDKLATAPGELLGVVFDWTA